MLELKYDIYFMNLKYVHSYHLEHEILCFSKTATDHRTGCVDEPRRFHGLHYVVILNCAIATDVVGEHNGFKFLEGV